MEVAHRHQIDEEAALVLVGLCEWCVEVFEFDTSEIAPHQRGLVQHKISGHFDT